MGVALGNRQLAKAPPSANINTVDICIVVAPTLPGLFPISLRGAQPTVGRVGIVAVAQASKIQGQTAFHVRTCSTSDVITPSANSIVFSQQASGTGPVCVSEACVQRHRETRPTEVDIAHTHAHTHIFVVIFSPGENDKNQALVFASATVKHQSSLLDHIKEGIIIDMSSEHEKPIMDEIGPDFPFKPTPKAAPPTLKIDHDCGVKITTVSPVSVAFPMSG